MPTAYRASPAANTEGTVVGIEEVVRSELISGVPDLLARIDLITTTDDALVITDFKTARSRWSQDQADNSADQLLLYSELVRRMMPDRDVRLWFLVLTKAKTPAVKHSMSKPAAAVLIEQQKPSSTPGEPSKTATSTRPRVP